MRQQIALSFILVAIIGLIYSPVILSIGMIGLSLVALLDWPLALNPDLGQNFRRFLSSPAYLAVTVFFFIILVSGLWSEDWTYLIRRLRLKVPFLILPFAFISIPRISQRQYLGVFYFLVFVIFLTSIGVGANYLLHFEEIQKMIGQGQSIPTPRGHIRFSLLLALSIVAGAYLWYKDFQWKWNWERNLLAFITLFLFGFIHVLSVRSGLLVLYLSIFVLSLRYVWLTRRFSILLAAIIGLAIIPTLAYNTLPSFQKKIDYALWDWRMYQEGKGANYSDSERLTSILVGIELCKANPILGVGAGDLKQEITQVYADKYPEMSFPKWPHNQLLSTYASTGIFGLLAFLWAFFYPLWHQKNYRAPLFLALHVIIFCSFMMENTIETSIGVGIYILFLLLGVHFLADDD